MGRNGETALVKINAAWWWSLNPAFSSQHREVDLEDDC
jgi:hypothetical protein